MAIGLQQMNQQFQDRQASIARQAQEQQNLAARQRSYVDQMKQFQASGDWRGAYDYAKQFDTENKTMNRKRWNYERLGARKNFGPYDFGKGNYEDWLKYQDLTRSGIVGLNRSAAQQSQLLNEYQKNVAGHRATSFAENLPQYIEGETSSLRNALQEKMQSGRKNLLAEMNRRGLLRSGQRGMGEVNLASQIGGEYEKGRADIYTRAQQKAQELFTNPLLKDSQYGAQLADLQNRMQGIRDAESASKSALFGQAAGLIGQGLGTGFGNMQDGKSFWGGK